MDLFQPGGHGREAGEGTPILDGVACILQGGLAP